MADNVVQEAVVHVRYNGLSYDPTFNELDLGDLSTDDEVKQAVANYVDTPVAKLRDFVVEKNQETGDVTVRPQAVFG